MTQTPARRDVVSFVRRSTRMNASQQRNWEAHQARWVLPLAHRELSTSVAPGQPFDAEAIWGRTAPLWLEIGTGNGEACAAIAGRHPEVNYLGFEVFRPAVASALGLVAREGLTNVRFAEVDGVEALAHWIPADSVDRIFTFFPDPWHKARHHKRRLVNPATAALIASRLRPGGSWHLATDWPDYAEHMREVLDGRTDLVNVHLNGSAHRDVDPDGWAPRPEARPLTRFEQRGLAAGRVIRDLVYVRPAAGPAHA
ncbi:tRNA (guanosine(46)-N7)-methyltransferase TrmB [Raineyella fluvialis]|uniref:tRNA (guanine-N(7)-)-methyltransferase n=1 Tax=Raineyella fluvialis TaxID=2662261 RepID=A0A5Q2FAE3_9ACTN|nr:tRNA (guanosine(46)-N7)-methyltransferase TrmB [Raineyella fluvialis]QGF22707.1 tRNA (guanosine(46)-N7)-methyltransferase TrmB [Raineyella fluvialis]